MSCNYCWNQPIKHGKYDFYLDGKLTANEIVYKVLTEDKETENINLADKVQELESRLQTHFEFKTVEVLPDEGEETVIYLVANDDKSGDKDGYNEYMWVKEKGEFELIGSGTYAQQQADLQAEIDRASAAEQVLTENLATEVTDRTNADNALDEKIENRVIINDPITITEGDNTTSITSDTISTTTLTGTLDAESMKNSLTAEAIQKVVPMAWGTFDTAPSAPNEKSLAIGNGAIAKGGASVVIGDNASSDKSLAVVIGHGAVAKDNFAIVVGANSSAEYTGASVGHGARAKSESVAFGLRATAENTKVVAIGADATSHVTRTVTIGGKFSETTDSGNVTHTCTTKGTGSITIGAGANTLNTTKTVDGVETTVESSNSITIGCKASNTGADSVVIGASAKNVKRYNVVIGAAAVTPQNDEQCVVIGRGAISYNYGVGIGTSANGGIQGVTIGHYAQSQYMGVSCGKSAYAAQASTAIGFQSKANAPRTIALGWQASVNDNGATVIRSTSEDGTKTQLYFSGQNTPLALKYYPTEWEKKQDVDEQGNPKVDDEGNPIMVDDKDKPTKGQAMMGYVVSKVITNDEGKQETKVVECGTNLLAALFPNHGLGDNPFQPTTTAIDGEIISFHPSDLDLPIEETPIEEEYKPLPVYPIVEPTIDEISE